MKTITVLALALFASWSAEPQSQEARSAAKPQMTAKADGGQLKAQQIATYPTDMCLVSEEPLDAMGAPIDVMHEERLVRFCCKGCIKMFKKDPQAVFAKIDKLVVAQQRESYPLETCVISGEPLDAMGEPVEHVYRTRLVRLCCKGCVKGFKKDPQAAMAKIDTALIAAQAPSYKATTCPVSDEALGKEPREILYGTRLVRLCCPACEKSFWDSPETFVAKLDRTAKSN